MHYYYYILDKNPNSWNTYVACTCRLVIYCSVFHMYSQMPPWNWICPLSFEQQQKIINLNLHMYFECLCFWIAKNAISNLRTWRWFLVVRLGIRKFTKLPKSSARTKLSTRWESPLHKLSKYVVKYITTGRHADIFSDHVVPILLHAHFGSSQCRLCRRGNIKITHSMAPVWRRSTHRLLSTAWSSRSCTTTR